MLLLDGPVDEKESLMPCQPLDFIGKKARAWNPGKKKARQSRAFSTTQRAGVFPRDTPYLVGFISSAL